MLFKFDDKFLPYTCFQKEIEISHGATLGRNMEELLNRYPQLLIFLSDNQADEAKKTSLKLNGEYIWKSESKDLPVSAGDVMEFGRDIPEGSGAVGKMVVGAVIVLAAVLMSPFTMGASAAILSAKAALFIGMMGASIVLMGISEALIGTPKMGESSNSATYTYSGIKNTTAAGTPLNIVYGTHRVGGHLANVYTDAIDNDTYLYAQIALCEGEIADITDLEINGNPLSFYDPNSYEIIKELGVETPSAMKYFSRTENTTSYEQIVYDSTPAIKRTSKTVSAARVTITLPSGLYQANDKGGLNSASVNLKIQYKKSTDSSYSTWVEVGQRDSSGNPFTDPSGNIFISGNTRSAIVKDYTVFFPSQDMYDVKVVRVTADRQTAGSLSIGDQVNLQSITEINYGDFLYPHTAMLGFKIKATEQLSGGMPQITSLVKGTKVLVPNIYHPELEMGYGAGKKYEQSTWDGTWAATKQYTSNPVWCLFDLLTNERYGLGNDYKLDPSRLSLMKAQFFMMAKHCDEIIAVKVGTKPDGSDDIVYEPRYELNLVIDNSRSAQEWIGVIASTMQASIYYTEGRLWLDIDRSKSISGIFNMSNIEKSSFNVTGTSYRSIPNVYEVQYPNKDNKYTIDTFRVESYKVQNDAFTEEVKKQLSLVGVTNVNQCKRIGKYALLSGEYNNKIVSFKTGAEGLNFLIGDVVAVQHDVPQWGFGGRVLSYNASKLQIELSQEVPPEAGYSYSIQVSHKGQAPQEINLVAVTQYAVGTSYTVGDGVAINGQTYLCLQTHVATLDCAPEDESGNWINYWRRTTVVQLASAPAAPFTRDDKYAIGTITNDVALYRIVYIRRDSDEKVEIRCTSYTDALYTEAENIADISVITPTNYSMLHDPVKSSVGAISATERLIVAKNGYVRSAIDVSFTPQTQSSFWKNASVYYRYSGLSPEAVWRYWGDTYDITTVTDIEEPYASGQSITYDVLVTSNYRNGSRQTIAEALAEAVPPVCQVTIYGKMKPPATVSSVTASVATGGNIVLSWTPVGDVDLAGYEISQIVSGTTTVLETCFVGQTYSIPPKPAGSYVWRIRALDTSGNYSLAYTSTTPLVIGVPSTVTISNSIVGDVAVLTWTASFSVYPIAYYTVTANGVSYRTDSLTFSQKVTWGGGRVFTVRATDIAGNSGAPATITVTVSSPSAPQVTYTVIGEYVTVAWTVAAGSLPIVNYTLSSSDSVGASVNQSLLASSFSTKVDWHGSKTFSVVAVDAAGNNSAVGSVVATIASPSISAASYKFIGDTVAIEWVVSEGSLPVKAYEISSLALGSAEEVDRLLTSSTYSQKVNWEGSRNFGIEVIDSTGQASGAYVVTVEIAPPGQVVNPTPQVIDNNVLLKWSPPATGTLPVEYYVIKKGTTYATADTIGTLSGTFNVIFESQAGNYTYWVVAVDTAANYGDPVSLAAFVNQPPDYVLYDNRVITWSGTKTNLAVDPYNIAVPDVDLTTTFQSHFTSKSWATPQNQIDAGYAYYIQPMLTSGSYSETIDYGAVIGGTKIVLDLQTTTITGSVTITPSISIKLNSGDAWTTYNDTYQIFGTNFRYVKIDLVFSSDDKGILSINQSNLRLDMKQKTLSGSLSIPDLTSGSATVSLIDSSSNPVFIDVSSISVSANSSSSSIFAVYDFVDAPYPTSFKIYLYDATGTRVTGSASWTVRGV